MPPLTRKYPTRVYWKEACGGPRFCWSIPGLTQQGWVAVNFNYQGSTGTNLHTMSRVLYGTIFGCHAILLANFWYYLHTTIFEDTFRPHPKVRLHNLGLGTYCGFPPVGWVHIGYLFLMVFISFYRSYVRCWYKIVVFYTFRIWVRHPYPTFSVG